MGGEQFARHEAIPFAFGSLTGLRSFRLHADGSLNGINFTQQYKEGENIAYCANGLKEGARYEYDYNRDMPTHHIGVQWCTCGIYAYYDGQNQYGQRNNVTGLIQGYGKCTYGAHGFRAEKVKLLAIINPHLSDTYVKEQARKDEAAKKDPPDPYKPPWRARFYESKASTITWIASLVLYLVLSSTMTIWMESVLSTLIGLAFWISALVAGNMVMYRQRRWRNRRYSRSLLQRFVTAPDVDTTVTPQHFAKITARYPNVPQYRTVSEALKIFPLTDYWEETPGGKERAKTRGRFY